MKTLNYAPEAYKLLNGLFCVYKPAGLHYLRVRNTLAFNLCRDLNCMEVRPVKDYITLEGSVASGKPLSVSVSQSFADHPLVVGPRYQPQDLRIKVAGMPGRDASGVMVVGVNNGCWAAGQFHDKNPVQTLEVKGQFGIATSNFMLDGKVIEKATFDKIRHQFLDRTLASIQASQQTAAFEFANIPICSQEAYEAACHGLVRPTGKCPTLLYNIQCTEFNLPYFTLQMQCINPTVEYISEMVNQIGIYLRSCAVCCQIRCIRYGHFTLDHALLRKHWTLEHILGNVILCKDISDPETVISNSHHLSPISKETIRTSIETTQEIWRNEQLECDSNDIEAELRLEEELQSRRVFEKK